MLQIESRSGCDTILAMKMRHTGKEVGSRVFCALISGVLILTHLNSFAQGPYRIDALQYRGFTVPPGFQHRMALQESGVADTPEIIFGDGTPNTFRGGIFALARCGEFLYGIEFVNGPGTDCRLVRITTTGFTQAVRVGTVPIGHPAVEGLAAVDGELYGISVSFPNHTSRLIKINKETGVGTAIGEEGPFNVIIMGLAYDPVGKKLYGAGVPWGEGETAVNEANLYQINLSTGEISEIGALGTLLHSLTWHPILGLIGAFHQMFQISTTTGAATAVDPNAEFAHDDTPGNGVYALASEVGEIVSPTGSLRITDVVFLPETLDLGITFTSEPGKSYEIQVSNNLDFFSRLSDAVGAADSNETTVEANTAGQPARYYRVVQTD